MSPSNSDGSLSNSGESSSTHSQNSSVKRSFSKTYLKQNDTDNETKHKRIKDDKFSQENLNEAAQKTSNGYMTRNRYNKTLQGVQDVIKSENNEEIDEQLNTKFKNAKSVRNSKRKKKKLELDDEIDEFESEELFKKSFIKSGKGKRIRNTKSKNMKLQLGYVFTHDISPPNMKEKHKFVEKNNVIPSLYDSDSESETCYFHKNDTTKSENEIKKESISKPALDYTCPEFTKNDEVKTYCNKKRPLNKNPKTSLTHSPSNMKTSIKNMLPNSENKYIASYQIKNEKFDNGPQLLFLSKQSTLNSTKNTKFLKDLPKNNSTMTANHQNTNNKEFNEKKISKNSEKMCGLKESSDLSNVVINSNLTYHYENVYQNENNKISNFSDSTIISNCLNENNDDQSILVTEEFIRELEKELKTETDASQDVSRNLQQPHHNLNVVDLDVTSIISPEKSKVPSSNCTLNQSNIYETNSSTSEDSDFERFNSSSSSIILDEEIPKQKETKIFNNTFNNMLSIFDIPEENTFDNSFNNIKQNSLIENSNIEVNSNIPEKPNYLEPIDTAISNSDLPVKSNLMTKEIMIKEEKGAVEASSSNEEKVNSNLRTLNLFVNQNIFNSFNHENKRKSEAFVKEFINSGLDENRVVDFNISSSSKKIKSTQLKPKCHCNVMFKFNKETNKILTSKLKHFAFNNCAKKNREKFLHKKHLEAIMLKNLIEENKKYTMKSDKFIPTYKSILISGKNKNSNNFKEKDHIKPSILSMLKDVYVDVEYLSDKCCDYIHVKNEDELFKKPVSNYKNIKTNFQASEETPLNSICPVKNNTVPALINNAKMISSDQKCIDFEKKKIDESNFYKPTQKPDILFFSKNIETNIVTFDSKTNKSPNENNKSEFNIENDKFKVAENIMQKNDLKSNTFYNNNFKPIDVISCTKEKKIETNKSPIKINNTDGVFKLCKTYSNPKTKPKIKIEEDLNYSTIGENNHTVNITKRNHSEFVLKSNFCPSNYQKPFTLVNENDNSNNDCKKPKIDIKNNKIRSINILSSDKSEDISYNTEYSHAKKLSFNLKDENNADSISQHVPKLPNKNMLEVSKNGAVNSLNNNSSNKKQEIVTTSLHKRKLTMKSTIELSDNNDKKLQTDFISRPTPKLPNISIFDPSNKAINSLLNNKSSDDDDNKLQTDFISRHTPELPTISMFDPSNKAINSLLNNKSSDDDDKLQTDLISQHIPELPTISMFEPLNKDNNSFLNNKNSDDDNKLQTDFIPRHTPELPTISMFEPSHKDINSLLNNKSSDDDDDNKLQTDSISELIPEPPNKFELCNSDIKNLNNTRNFLNISSSDDEDNNLQIDSIPEHIPEIVQSMFELPNNNTENILCDNSSDDDSDRLQIEDDEDNFDLSKNSSISHPIINNTKNSIITSAKSLDTNILKNDVDNFDLSKNSSISHPIINNTKNSIITGAKSLDTNILSRKTVFKTFGENKLLNQENNEPSIKIREEKDDTVSKHNVPEKECGLLPNNRLKSCALKKENNSLASYNLNTVMTVEMCNEFYKNKSFGNKYSNENDLIPKNIRDILTEMHVDEVFVTNCQHMVEFYNDDVGTSFQAESKNFKSEKKMICDVAAKNSENNKDHEINKSTLNNSETISGKEFNETYEENCLTEDENTKTKKSNSPKKPNNVKSNAKIRHQFREFIQSNKSLNEIMESKEFRNLRFFKEEEIAVSIGVLIFEQSLDVPIINGLSVYRVNYEQMSADEINKQLGSTNLNIQCPKVLKLTSITLALVKMLRSDTLIDLILNVIRKNLLNKKMNTNHTIDHHLITQTTYFVDICVRLRLLKTLQTFIFDSMVLLPNKYCCVIFISLLLWNNCLPIRLNNEQDPVLIMVLSCLIAKKKFYCEQTIGYDIFQRELINLLSFHFNYSFSKDLPTNFMDHSNKPDFFVSMVMFLKCCDSKGLIEFFTNCLFPMIDNYLTTKQNENIVLKTMESINIAIRPFKKSCNYTVASYLNKCKGFINSSKDEKEHVYNVTYNSYKDLLNKFIEYLNDKRPRSQLFEELLVSIIMVLGSVDYISSAVTLMKWKPSFKMSPVLYKKINLFKSIVSSTLWNELCTFDDNNTIKCLLNSSLLKKDVFNVITQLHALR